MKREEAIAILQDKHDECKAFYDLAAHPEDAYPGAKEYMEALQMALAALRGPTREQVEKLQGDFIHEGPLVRGGVDWYRCSKCGALASGVEVQNRFCSACGSPMTDEAVKITLRRLEALKDEFD